MYKIQNRSYAQIATPKHIKKNNIQVNLVAYVVEVLKSVTEKANIESNVTEIISYAIISAITHLYIKLTTEELSKNLFPSRNLKSISTVRWIVIQTTFQSFT